MNIDIREMVISDYDAVIRLWSATESMLLREADSKENINKYLHRNPGLSFIALEGYRAIGAVLAGTDGRRGYLQHLAVFPEFRNKGIGKRLVRKAVDALSAIGISKTHLFVSNENIHAQNFYRNLGWQQREEVRMFSYNMSSNENV